MWLTLCQRRWWTASNPTTNTHGRFASNFHYTSISALDHLHKYEFIPDIPLNPEVYGDPEEHPQKELYWGHVNPIGPRACYDEVMCYVVLQDIIFE